jgi:hypothetical protein
LIFSISLLLITFLFNWLKNSIIASSSAVAAANLGNKSRPPRALLFLIVILPLSLSLSEATNFALNISPSLRECMWHRNKKNILYEMGRGKVFGRWTYKHNKTGRLQAASKKHWRDKVSRRQRALCALMLYFWQVKQDTHSA